MTSNAFQIIVFETGFLTALVLLGAALMRFRVRWAWLLAVPTLYAAHKAIIFIGADGSLGDYVGGRYNWEGKIAGTVFWFAAALLLFRGQLSRVGLTFSQNGPARIFALSVAALSFVATAVFVAVYFEGTNAEPAVDMLYQATMPSLDEELGYRGVMLAMLIAGFTPRGAARAGLFVVLAAAVITSVQFWGAHSIFTDGAWAFEFRPWWNPPTLVYGLLWVTVRLGTGSLLLPLLLHSWANTAGYFL